MLTMPCDVGRLMRVRLRAHGDDVAEEALARWSAFDTPMERLRGAQATEGAPLDARIWLSAWPLTLVKSLLDRRAPPAPDVVGDPLSPVDSPVFEALSGLSRIDPAGFALLLDVVREDLDLLAWRASLSESESLLEERLALALYRYFVLRAGVLPRIEDPRERAALAARRFREGEGSELASLRAARSALGDDSLTLPALRALEAAGAARSIDLLAADPSLSVVLGPLAKRAFLRALRLEKVSDDRESVDLDPLISVIERDIEAVRPRTPDAHPSIDVLAQFASARLPEARRAATIEHLLACRNGVCLAHLRAEVGGRDAVERALAGPMSEPPPSQGRRPLPPLFRATPRMIRCRDVLWDTFQAMAREEGRDVDDLVEDAMERYRALRDHVREASGPARDIPEPPPTRRRSSHPPGDPWLRETATGRAGLRLGSPPTAQGGFTENANEEPTLDNPIDEITKKRPL